MAWWRFGLLLLERAMKLLPHRCLFLLAIGVFFAAAVCPAAVLADVFVLKSGGRVRGTWLNRDEAPRKTFVIRTAGGKVVLDRDQVAEVVSQSTTELEYEKIRPTYPDTVDGHWRLAEWCLENRLSEQRKIHLRRILELDLNHPKARNVLGYRQVEGKWMTREEEMGSRGMRQYKGQYRTSQEIFLLRREEKRKLAHGEWLKKLKRWRGSLATNHQGKIDKARENILAIRDPYASEAVAQHLQREDYRAVKLLYLQALSQIATPAALKTLVDQSLGDADEEVRYSSIDYLVTAKRPEIVGLYIKFLGSKNNREVNRAAFALGRLGNAEAISPLVDALITVHKTKIGGGQEGQIGASFPSNSGGGLSVGGKGPKIVKRSMRNPEVLDALVKLSGGADFDYDVQAWRYWYAAEQKPKNVNARRD